MNDLLTREVPLLLKRIELVWKAYLQRREIKKASSTAAWFGAYKALVESQNRQFISSLPSFPSQVEDVKRFSDNIRQVKKSALKNYVPRRVCFSDSLAAFLREDIISVHQDLNFGQPGSSSPHFKQTAKELSPLIQQIGFEIDGVLVGCGYGNALLGRQDLMRAISDRVDAYEYIQSLPEYRRARFVFYGVPPVYDDYVLAAWDTLEAEMRTYVVGCRNAVYVSLRKLAGPFGLLPIPVTNSSDGTHLAGKGAGRFISAIDEAFDLRTMPGSIIYA